jgi:hypothetical protein
MRKLVLLIAVIIILAAFAGCLGGEAGEKKDKEILLVQKTGKIAPLSGWIDEDGNEHASQSFEVVLNDTNIVTAKFSIKVDDSNPENSETDDGSAPDEITVTVSSGNSSEKKSGPTPYSTMVEFKAPGGTEAPQYLDSRWTVQIEADLGGGKPMFIFGRIVYIDQGVAYTINAEYTYMAAEETE